MEDKSYNTKSFYGVTVSWGYFASGRKAEIDFGLPTPFGKVSLEDLRQYQKGFALAIEFAENLEREGY